MTTNIAIRLQAEGSAEIKRAFDDVGNAGKTAFDGVTSALDRTGAASDKVVDKVRQAGEAARSAQGGGAAGGSAGGASPSAREVERIRTQLDDEYRKAKQLDRAGTVIERGYSAGAFSDAERARLTDLAAQRYGAGAPRNDNVRGLDSRDKSFIQYSAFSGVSSLSAGASVSTIAAQQGTGIVQLLADREGGLKAGLADLGTTAAKLVTPFALAGAAAVAATAIFAMAASSYSRDQTTLTNALKLNGRTTDATVAQLDTLARSNAEAGKVSTSTAREIVAGYASTGEIGTTVLDTLIQKTGDYAKLTGQDVPAATAELARMFSDPAKGAEDLGNKLGGIDDKTRQYIQTLAEMGDKIGAQTALSEAFRAQVAANTDQTTRWGQAWNFVSSTADKAWESIKRAAGGAVSTLQQVLGDLSYRVEQAEKNAPGSEFTRQLRAQRDAAKAEADKLAAEEAKRVADAQSAKDSVAAAGVARGLDPQFARLSEIDRQTTTLRDALSNPDARSRMDPAALEAAERAYNGLVRARETMVDTNGKLVTSEEVVRRQGVLALEAAKATTAEEKAAVAEKQKQLELLGKTVSRQSASDQIANAGAVARISADDKGGKGKTEADDDFDRAVKQTENSIRKQQERAETYGQTADVVARYRTETELLTAAKRAERDVTPDLTARIKHLSDQAAEAAKRNDDLKDSMRTIDTVRSTGSDGIRTLISDLQKGASAATILNDVLGRIASSLGNFAGDQIANAFFGQRGTSGGWLANLFGQSAAGGSTESGLPNLNFGYDSGGYTGPGGRFDPAGIVHRGEVVFSQDDVRRAGGVSTVEAIRRGGRGYAAGGYVGDGGYTMPGAGRAANDTGGPTPISLNVINQMPNAKIETREVPDGRGGRRQEMVVSETVAKGIQSPQGQAALGQQRVARR